MLSSGQIVNSFFNYVKNIINYYIIISPHHKNKTSYDKEHTQFGQV